MTDSSVAGFDSTAVRRWLGILHGDSPGQLHICSTGDWTGRVFTDLDAATKYVTYLNGDGREGIYARVTTIRAALQPGKRGGAADSAALPALWADLDIAGPGHAEQNLPPDEDAAKKIIATSGLPSPTLWIHSGGGLYPIWLLTQPHHITDDNLDQAKHLTADWQRVIEHAAAVHGWRYGRGVGDLARVLRIPGTINRKAGLARPCRITAATQARYSLQLLQDALDAAIARIAPPAPQPASPAPLSPAERPDTATRPGEDYAARTNWPAILEPAGWRVHYRQDDVTYWTRPGKPTGISASTNALGTDRLHVFTTAAPPLQGGESYSKLGAYAQLHHAGDHKAAARALGRLGYGAPLPDPAVEQRAMLRDLLGDQAADPPSQPPSAPMHKAAGGGKYFTDTGALLAATLAADIAALGPLAAGTDDIMWSYRDGVWSADKHVVRNRAARLLGERYRRNHLAAAEDLIRADSPRITCDPITDLINFRNGLLDWRTGQLRPHTPDVLSTVQLAVNWTPDATCPEFTRFLTEVVPIDMAPVVWELIGYLMYSGNPLHKAVMLMGSGRNGKGTFLRAVVSLLGERNITAASLHDLVSTRFTTASLFGKLANIAGDIDPTYLESTAVFKAITGQDQISAEHKGRDRFDFTPWAVPVFSANEIPASADTTVGYLSRWLAVPFPNSFLGREDRGMDAKLHAELPGIAAKAIPALRQLMDRGDFDRPESGQAAYDEFVRRVDQVRAWINDSCELEPGPHEANAHPFVNRIELYQKYKQWCSRDGHKPLQAAKFYDRVAAAGATPIKIMGTRGYRGITAWPVERAPNENPAPGLIRENDWLGAGGARNP